MSGARVIVIGGGVIGSAAAYYLSRAGVEVQLLERSFTPAGATASGASAGGVRQQGRDDREMPLAVMAVKELWTDLEGELGFDMHYRRGGMTVVIDQPEHLEPLRRRVAHEQSIGLDDIEVVVGQDLHELIPGLAPGILAGSYCRSDGQADPILATRGLQVGVERAGGSVYYGCPVHQLKVDGDRITGVVTPQGVFEADHFIVAAGVWTNDVLRHVGAHLPLELRALQMMVTEKAEPTLTQVLGWAGRAISLKQAPAGPFVVGGGWPADGRYEGENATILESILGSARTVVDLMPGLGELRLVRSWAGLEAFTPDGIPIIDTEVGTSNLTVAAGFCGHGFCIAPAVGKMIAQGLISGSWPELLRPFGRDRFNV